MPSPADLFLSPDLTEAEAHAYLASLGFRDAAAIDGHLQQMADDLVVREALGRLAPDLLQSVLESPDPDAAVMGVAHYVQGRTGRAMFLDYLREDPRALHVLTYVMGASPVLAEILIRTPEYFHWLVPQIERSIPDRQDHEEELVSALSTLGDPNEGLDVLRRWKRRETLRIGTRDLLRRDTFASVTSQLSDVACVAIDFALSIVIRQQLNDAGLEHPPGTFAVVALGLLGAGELGYGCDVDLMYVYETGPQDPSGEGRAFFSRAAAALTEALEAESRDGVLYRAQPSPIEIRALDEYSQHYGASGDTAERCRLSRARAIAGDANLGRRFLACCETFVYGQTQAADWDGVPATAPSQHVEWFAQRLQVQNGADHHALRGAGTLAALEAATEIGAISEDIRRNLDHAYVILRSAEHRAQLGVKEDLDKQLALARARVAEICG